ncbi:MAG TPA: hypothetical protein VFQ67_17845 [Allosphingosinicella sp.]|nr:hypothetical protein [Allosphingosinicella sp.]
MAGLLALLSACAGKPAPAPAAAPPLRQAPPASAAPVAAAPVAADPADWRDRPLTPGDWSYDPGAGEARYAGFSLRCDGASRRVTLSRAGALAPLRLRTSFGEHVLEPGAALPADDPRLDEIAFSRGRFLVEAKGMADLVLPAWPEPARVIEDCRG